jgi:hypothetical protein
MEPTLRDVPVGQDGKVAVGVYFAALVNDGFTVANTEESAEYPGMRWSNPSDVTLKDTRP